MSQSSSQDLRFSINESVWLKNGERAEDVVSLALEPDITIEENPHYVSIRGGLLLNGEYHPREGTLKEELLDDTVERSNFRVVDVIRTSDEGTMLFEHRFPVDITIPSNRVDDSDDLQVNVETFDYTLPEDGCIQLQAEVVISGLVDAVETRHEVEGDEAEGTVAESEEDEDVNAFDPTENVNFETYREPVEGSEQEEEAPEIGLNAQEEEERAGDTAFVEQLEASEEFSQIYQEVEATDRDFYSADNRSEQQEKLPIDADIFFEGENVGLEEVDDSAHAPIEQQKRSENALYLTKMLTNADEQFSRVRMCIVQSGDSLESISERYQVPVPSLLRRNHLHSESVEEGQIIYIPGTKR